MANQDFNSTVSSLFQGMDNFITSKTVVGEPKQVGDVILLPLIEVAFGVGAGASIGDKKNNGGGGLGGKMSPNAVLVIKDGNAKLVNIKNQDTLTKVLDMVPDLVDKLKKKDSDMPTDEEVVEVAFPDKEV